METPGPADSGPGGGKAMRWWKLLFPFGFFRLFQRSGRRLCYGATNGGSEDKGDIRDDDFITVRAGEGDETSALICGADDERGEGEVWTVIGDDGIRGGHLRFRLEI